MIIIHDNNIKYVKDSFALFSIHINKTIDVQY